MTELHQSVFTGVIGRLRALFSVFQISVKAKCNYFNNLSLLPGLSSDWEPQKKVEVEVGGAISGVPGSEIEHFIHSCHKQRCMTHDRSTSAACIAMRKNLPTESLGRLTNTASHL